MKTNWQIKTLGEVADILMGQSPPSNTYNTLGAGLPFFQGKADFNDVYPSISKYCSKPVRVAQKDDVLLSVRAPVGPVNLAPSEICIGRGLSAIRGRRNVLNQMYLFYFMKLNELALGKKGTGSTFSSINRRDIERINLPLPPISAQQQIVEKLDAIRKLQELNNNEIEKTEELFESLLNSKLKFSPAYRKSNLEDVVVLKRGPFGGSLKKEIFVPSGYKVYEQRNAINDDFTLCRYFITEEKYKEMADFAIKAGDLIISCSGTIGKVALAPDNVSSGIINQALLRITPKRDSVIGPYLKYLIQSEDMQYKMFGGARGSSIKNIVSIKEIKRIVVHLPSIKEQQQIVKELDAVRETYEIKMLSREKLFEFFESTLSKLMRPN